MSANIVRFKFIACVAAISFSQMACSIELELPEAVEKSVEAAASEIKWAARGLGGATRDFRSFLPIVVVILVIQTLVGILNLITRWRIMRSIAKLDLRPRSTTLDDQSSSGPDA